jgi:uncharacterized membrane protein
MTRKTFLAIFSIAAILRLLMLNVAPLWYDENFTLILARLPLDKMIQATAGDVHPPLWYMLEWILFHLAPHAPAWMIRLPALLFSLLALYMFDRLCDILRIPSRVRLLATVLMAVLPMQLWYAQEGRMYAMLEFLVLVTLYTGLTRKWILFTVASIAMMYTQNYGMFYLAIIAVILVVMDWQNAMAVIYSGLTTVLIYMPWAFMLMSQMTEIEGRYWITDASAGAVLGILYKQFWASAMSEPGILTSYVVTFAALLIGLYYLLGEKITAWWIVVTMAFAPVGVAWLASILWQPLLLFRPLIGISPFLYLIVSWPATEASLIKARRYQIAYAACFVLPLLIFGLGGYYYNITAMKGDGAVSPMMDTLTYITANWQEGDVIYYADDGPMVNLMPYTALPQYKMPACDERVGYAPVLGSLSDTTRAAFGISIANLADVPHTRAWVFAPRSPLHPQCYEDQIAAIAPEGQQLITVDDNEFLTSGVWLVEK